MPNDPRKNLSRAAVLCCLVFGLHTAISAQEPPNPIATPAASTPPAQADVTQNQGPPILHDGIPIKLELMSKVDSHTAKAEDQIQFQVVNDVVVGGIRVLRRGTVVTGTVTNASSSKTMGRAGQVSFTIDDIKLQDGAKVTVRAFNKSKGENRTGDMVALMVSAPMVAAPFLLFIHGDNTVFPKGTQITAFVNGDVKLNPAGFAPPPASP
ncbi:MAG: hypothetical protein WAL75_25185 [Terracidiphilus sp.]